MREMCSGLSVLTDGQIKVNFLIPVIIQRVNNYCIFEGPYEVRVMSDRTWKAVMVVRYKAEKMGFFYE